MMVFRTTFKRPADLPFPRIWHKFTVNKGGVELPVKVQDLTSEHLEAAIGLLNRYYNRDEIASQCVDVLNHPIALAELDRFWRGIAQNNLSLVCIVDSPENTRSPEVIAFNCIDIISKDDHFEPWTSSDPASQLLSGSYELVARSCDVFTKFGVDRYLNANGLVVHPDWRRMDVAVELLKARIPLCKALGIKITATVFTGSASQAVAKKAGYTTLSEVTYADMAKLGYEFPGIEKNSKSSKLMVYLIE